MRCNPGAAPVSVPCSNAASYYDGTVALIEIVAPVAVVASAAFVVAVAAFVAVVASPAVVVLTAFVS